MFNFNELSSSHPLHAALAPEWWQSPFLFPVTDRHIHEDANGNLIAAVPELTWITRFPFLTRAVRISGFGTSYDHILSDGAVTIPPAIAASGHSSLILEVPLYHSPALLSTQAVLPLGKSVGQQFPAGLGQELPEYMYSALAVFVPDRQIFFQTDFANAEHFWTFFKKAVPEAMSELSVPLLWGIILLEGKLPHPVGMSREKCFHMGHNDVSLPKFINISPTNRCNLRCTICGSQQHIENNHIPRRFLDMDLFDKVAETLFPYCESIGLNSLGEPTLHKNFNRIVDAINAYGCTLTLQTNGTNMSARVFHSLLNARGEVSFSIDATGAVFEAQRVNARWEHVKANVQKLLAARDPGRLKVSLYPTVTRKTIPGMLDLCKWADTIGIDVINMHYYDPIYNGIEECPSPEEKENLELELRDYIRRKNPGIKIFLQYVELIEPKSIWQKLRRKLKKIVLKKGTTPPDSTPLKYPSRRFYHGEQPIRQRESGFYATHICAAPFINGGVGLDGELYVCCRTQNRVLGYAQSDESFFSLWFGDELQELRRLLQHGADPEKRWKECRACIQTYL